VAARFERRGGEAPAARGAGGGAAGVEGAGVGVVLREMVISRKGDGERGRKMKREMR